MRLPVCLLAALAVAGSLPSPANACAPAPRDGEVVRIAGESALIVWDPATKTEHFIRSASFVTTASDFGFLVPTPSKPELAEADDDMIPELMRYTQPRVVREATGLDVRPSCSALFFFSRAASVEATASAVAVAPVRVLDEQKVGGYDAVVLEADSATALSEWLKKHGYAEGPALTDWLRPYIAQKWKITAFKIAPGRKAQAVSTSAVRMSFTTERPFYPYREPADQRETRPASLPEAPDDRKLRVFFIGPGRHDGFIGEGGAPWPGRPRWAGPYARTQLPHKDWPFAIPAGAWLTDFEDPSFPRPGTDDVFFSAARDQTPIEPPPIVMPYRREVPLPLELVLVVGVGAFLLVRWRRRRAAATT